MAAKTTVRNTLNFVSLRAGAPVNCADFKINKLYICKLFTFVNTLQHVNSSNLRVLMSKFRVTSDFTYIINIKWNNILLGTNVQ